jgi:hypothetical protein
MAATNDQQSALAEATGFKAAVRASIMKKTINILENQGSFTAPQIARAKSIGQGQSLDSYYLAVAASTNVVASNVTYDFKNRTVVSDISDANLDSQVTTTVFTDLV